MIVLLRMLVMVSCLCLINSPVEIYAYESTLPQKYEQAPYQVQIQLLAKRHIQITPDRLQELKHETNLLMSGLVGSAWKLELQSNLSANLSADALDQWIKEIQPLNSQIYAEETVGAENQRPFDKRFIFTLEMREHEFLLEGIEYDAVTNQTTARIRRTTEEWRSIPVLLAEMTLQLFRPLFLITSQEDKIVHGHLRASSYGWGEEQASQVMLGSHYEVMQIYFDRQGKIQRRSAMPWTYLKLEGMSREEATMSVISAFRAPIAGARRRVQVVAIQTKVNLSQTTLHVVHQAPNKTLVPCVGTNLRVYTELPPRMLPEGQKPKPPLLSLQTDRYGNVDLKVHPESPIQFLNVISGENVIATVPIITGAHSRLELIVPDDSIRLAVEGRLAQLNRQMIDVVAVRIVTMARLRRLVDAENWKEYDLERKEIEPFLDGSMFVERLNEIRVFAVEAAKAQKNKSAEAQIVKMCTASQQMIERYFGDSEFIQNLKEFDGVRKSMLENPSPGIRP